MMRTLRAFFLVLAATALSPAAAQQQLPLGPEILAGTDAVSTPSVALAADGNFAAAWHPKSLIGAPFSPAVVRTYSPAGHPLRAGAAGLAGEPASLPRIAALPYGRYAAAWLSTNGVALAQLLDVSGAGNQHIPALELGPSSSEALLDSLPDGGFVTVRTLPSGALTAHRVNSFGRLNGSAIPVASQASQFSIAAQPDGGFIVAWADAGQGLFYRLFAPNGTSRTSARRPTTASGSDVRVSADASGHFVISWKEAARIVARRFQEDGQPREAEIMVADAVSAAHHDVAVRPDGSFLVLWSSTGVYASVYDSAGQPVGEAFPVPDAPAAGDLGGEAAGDVSGWVVSWISAGGDVFLRRIITTCGGGTPGLCLGGSRYRVEASWHTPATGARGSGRPVLLSEDTGAFWFFAPENLELTVKVLDGGAVNGRTWVFYSSLTDVELELTVTDRVTGEQRVYRNAAGTMASRADTGAFPAPTGPLTDALPAPSVFAVSRPLAAGPQTPLLDPTVEDGYQPWVASRGDDFSVVWQALLPDGDYSQHAVAGRTVTAGQAGPEVLLSQRSSFLAPTHLRLVPLASGEALATWTNLAGDSPSDAPRALSSELNLRARRLDTTGQPIGEEVPLEWSGSGGEAAADPEGGFVLVWSEATDGSIRVRRFQADGTPAGAAVQVADRGAVPAIAPLPGGRFFVAWQRSDSTFSRSRVVARLLGPDLAPQGSELEVSGDQGSRARLSTSPSGRLVIAWTEAGRFLARLLAPSGTLGDTLVINTAPPGHGLFGESVSMRPDGTFLALWAQYPHQSLRADVMARLHGPDGTPLGAPFRVQDELAGSPTAGGAAATPTGWVATWWSQEGVYARRLDSSCRNGALGFCLNQGRFRVEADWHVPATGARGTATPIVLSAKNDTGALWFFEPTNYELTVKVLDGRAVNGKFWVFYASLTDVEFDLTITDTVTGQKRTYHNPPGTMASRADTSAF